MQKFAFSNLVSNFTIPYYLRFIHYYTKVLILSFSLLLVFQSLHASEIKPLTEKQALHILIKQIQRDKLYASWTTVNCLTFLTENVTKNYIDFTVYEKHGGKCSGDPNISPIVDRFRVDCMTKNIQWYELVTDKFKPYETMLKMRANKTKNSTR